MSTCCSKETYCGLTDLAALVSKGLLQRKCACGNHTVAGGQCEECRKNQGTAFKRTEPPSVSKGAVAPAVGAGTFARTHMGYDFSRVATTHQHEKSFNNPTKAWGRTPATDDEEKPSPHKGGDATIECNGSGDYQIAYNNWATASCGTKDCVTAHESSHIADWRAKWPNGCKGQPKGYLPKGDPPDETLMTVSQYKSFLKDSECKAHTIDLECAKALPKTKGCEKTIDDYIDLTKDQKADACGMARWKKVLLGIGGGALVGAGIGALIGGGAGAAIGAGIGALAGLIGGLLA